MISITLYNLGLNLFVKIPKCCVVNLRKYCVCAVLSVKRLKEVVSHARFSFHCISLIFFVDGVLLWWLCFLTGF